MPMMSPIKMMMMHRHRRPGEIITNLALSRRRQTFFSNNNNNQHHHYHQSSLTNASLLTFLLSFCATLTPSAFLFRSVLGLCFGLLDSNSSIAEIME
jgi:hypothetical protein